MTRTPQPHARRGFVLLGALIASLVISVLAASVLAYIRLERANATTFTSSTRHEHAANTAIEEALALLHAFPDPRRIICARNGGDPDQPHTCTYHLTPPDRAYQLDLTQYDYPTNPLIIATAPADNPTISIHITVDPNNDIRISTWLITHP